MKTKKRFSKFTARALAFVLTFGAVPVATAAERGEYPPQGMGEITAFLPLSPDVAEQTVPYASELEDLTLPETLTATVRFAQSQSPADSGFDSLPTSDISGGGFNVFPLIETVTTTPASPEIIYDYTDYTEDEPEYEPDAETPADLQEPPYQPQPSETDMSVPVTWQSFPAFDGYEPGEYIFSPVIGGGFTALAEPPVITVTVENAPMAMAGIMPLSANEVNDTAGLTDAINAATGTAENPAVITVTADFDITEQITISAGKHVKITSGGTARTLTRGADFTDALFITNSSSSSLVFESIIIDGNKSGTDAIVDVRSSGSAFTMNAGTVLQNNGFTAVTAVSGTFTMNGGEIRDNARGVTVSSGGVFNMTGGKITDNVWDGNNTTGGVGVNGGTFTMTGGEISGNAVTGFVGG